MGKTSLLVRFNEDHFIIDQKTTIGVDYKAKEITIDHERVKLQVSDMRSLFTARIHYALTITDLGHGRTREVSFHDFSIL